MSLSARLHSKSRVILLVTLGVFIAALLFTAHRLSIICQNGWCSDLTSLREQWQLHQDSSDAVHQHKPLHQLNDAACKVFPDTSNVLLVMKTGASESSNKIPTQLMTNLKCLSDFLIFSDLEQEIAGYKIHDSLDEVLRDVQDNTSDFDIYRRQQQCAVDIESCNKYADAASEGWTLDKYKNVHIAEKTWKLRPNYDWYLYVDADSYVSWPTLVQWLKHLDPTTKYYLGSEALLGDFPFAHGGSGYLVSNAAMKSFFDGKTGVANQWDQRAMSECCGDFVFAMAMKNETDIYVTNTWPTVNGEKPHTLAYGWEQWCHPIVTMHRMNSQDVSDLHAFERELEFQPILRIKDMYHRFFEPHLVPVRADWDNLSDDTLYLDPDADHEEWEIGRAHTEGLSPLEKKAHIGFEACRQACLAAVDCFQWRYHQGTCATSRTFKHGSPTEVEQRMGDKWISGWNVDKILDWVRTNDECGDFVWPSI